MLHYGPFLELWLKRSQRGLKVGIFPVGRDESAFESDCERNVILEGFPLGGSEGLRALGADRPFSLLLLGCVGLWARSGKGKFYFAFDFGEASRGDSR
jgi:hypothetical protein